MSATIFPPFPAAAAAAAGFAPETPEMRPFGADLPAAIETASGALPAGAEAQVLGGAATCEPAAVPAVETVEPAPREVLHHDASLGGAEPEERALIAEGLALLADGRRRQNRGGRPTVMDGLMKARAATLVGTGLSLRQAAACLGIAHTTIARAAADDPAFHDEIEQARTRATLHPLACILRASGRNWKAAAWLLEHLAKNYYDKTPLERARQQAAREREEKLVEQLKAQILGQAIASGGVESGGEARRPLPSPGRAARLR